MDHSLQKLADQLLACANLTSTVSRQQNDLAFAFHCVMFAIGKQKGVDSFQFKEDFLDTASLHWKAEEMPQLVVTLLKQLEAGRPHRERGKE